MKKVWILVVIGIILALGIALTIMWQKGESKEIKIGVVLPLTGPSANHGQDARDGLEMAIEEINSLRSDKIRLIYEDDRSNPTDAVSATKKLIEVDKVKIIVGPISSTNALAIIPITEASHVLLFSPAASSSKISGKGKLFFRISLLADPQGAEAAHFVIKNLNCTYASILYINDETGISYANAFEKEFTTLGGSIAAKESYENTDNDFRTHIVKLKAKQTQVVYVPAVPSTLGLIAKQSYELNYDPIFVSNYGAEGEDLVRIAGNIVNDRVYLTSFNLDGDFVKRYQLRFGKQPGIAAPLAYDTLHILSNAITSASTVLPEQLSEKLHSITEYIGATGKLYFDKNGDPVREIVIRQVHNGTFEPFTSLKETPK